jgi:hypothetical protein
MMPGSSADNADAVVDGLEDALKALKAYHLAQMTGQSRCAKRDRTTPCGVLVDYLNWRGRQVAAEPRAVHRSAELIVSAKALQRRELLERLIKKIV